MSSTKCKNNAGGDHNQFDTPEKMQKLVSMMLFDKDYSGIFGSCDFFFMFTKADDTFVKNVKDGFQRIYDHLSNIRNMFREVLNNDSRDEFEGIIKELLDSIPENAKIGKLERGSIYKYFNRRKEVVDINIIIDADKLSSLRGSSSYKPALKAEFMAIIEDSPVAINKFLINIVRMQLVLDILNWIIEQRLKTGRRDQCACDNA